METTASTSSDVNSRPRHQRNYRLQPLRDWEIAQILAEESEDDLDDDDSDKDTTFVPEKLTNPVSSSSENSDVEERIADSRTNTCVTGNQERNVIWFSERDSGRSNSIPDFSGNHKVLVHGNTPLDFFDHLFPPELVSDIVYQTNLYACQNGKDNFCLSSSELKVFLGIVLVMTYIKYPRIRQYWSEQTGLRMDLIADTMSVNRFEEIRRYLHFTDTSSIPPDNKDKAIRIRPVLNKLHETFHNAVEPEEYHSVDEMMIPFKGRSSLKQYLPKKPKKWGYKMWVRAGISGYVYCFELYQGASGINPAVSACGAAGDVVLRLTHDLHGKNYKVYADNFFTSVPLVLKLKEKELWYVGTVRANRLQGAEKKLKPVKVLQKEGRGSVSVCTSNEDITVTRWIDNSAVHVLSSYAGKEPVSTAQRFSRKEKKFIEIQRPYSIELYNKHMGGVDLMDSLVALYRNDVRNKRWYMRIFYHMLNVTVVNSWILWKWEKYEALDLLEFKSRIATGLIYQGKAEMMKKKRGRPSDESQEPKKKRVSHSVPKELRLDGGQHYPKKSTESHANRCRDSQCKSKTRFQCGTCKVPVCPQCMERFHRK